MRQSRHPGGTLEGSGYSREEEAAIDQGNGPRPEGEHDRSPDEQGLGYDHDPPAVMAIGEMPRPKREDHERSDLHEPHVPEDNGGFGFEIEIPAHSHRHHLKAEVGKEGTGDKESEIF